MSNLPSVLIASPSGDNVSTEFAMSLAALTATSTSKFTLMLANVRTSNIPVSRNNLSKTALEAETDYILWIDADMEFPPYLLEKLHRANKDIIGTNYPRREAPYGSTCPPGEGLYKVNGMGFGAVLMKTEILKTIPKPWFYTYYKDPEDLDSFITSDYYFCNKASLQGYEIWVDGELSKSLGHVASRTLRL